MSGGDIERGSVSDVDLVGSRHSTCLSLELGQVLPQRAPRRQWLASMRRAGIPCSIELGYPILRSSKSHEIAERGNRADGPLNSSQLATDE